MNLIGFLGVAIFCVLAFLFSKHKKYIDWKLVIWGIVMQFLIAGIILGKGLVSLIPFFIWIYAVVWYNLNVLILKDKNTIISGIISLLVTAALSYFVYLLGSNISSAILSILWYIFIAVGMITTSLTSFKINIKLYKKWSNIFGVLIPILLFGNIIASGKTGSDFFNSVGESVTNFLAFAASGGDFVFGHLFSEDFIFIINVGVNSIFTVALVGLLESLGIMNKIITSIARFIDWNMRGMNITPLSGVETLVGIASIPGGSDTVFLVKNYLPYLTRSEILFSISSIMATITAGLFAAYVSIGISATHLLAASAMSVPAAVVVSKIFYPEVDKPVTIAKDMKLVEDPNYGKPMQAIMDSISNAVQTVLIMGGCLLVFISLISIIDGMLGKLDAYVDGQLLKGSLNMYKEYNGIIPGSLKTLFGYIFSPLAFTMGVPFEDMLEVGYLMGAKISINEFVAFTQLGEFMKSNLLTEKSIIISSFALCGFANPSTVAQALGKVLPFSGDNKKNYIDLAFKTMFIGAGASWMTAAIAGIIYSLI